MIPEGPELVGLLAAPDRVAIVGASADVNRPAGRPLDYLHRYGFNGQAVAVNPRRSEINGIRSVPRLTDLDAGSVDVAMVTLAAPLVVDALRDAERIGVRAAVVIGSGFEDHEGEHRAALAAFAAASPMRIIGPNCLGSVAVPNAAYLSFSSVLRAEQPKPGRVGMVTQSGALGNSLLQTLIRRRVGLAHWVSTGNEVDVGAIELAVGMLGSEGIDAVGLFLEGITDLDWLPALDAVLRDGSKRLFVLKAARSPEGGRAAVGHTGRVVGSADASRAILAEVGAREVATVGALADALAIGDICPELLTGARPRVALVSVSGAAGVIAADRVAASPRLRMAEIDTAGSGGLDARLTPANPLDIPFLGETDTFADAIAAVAGAGAADVVVAVESGLAHDRPTLVARLVADRAAVPIVLTSLSEDDQVPPALVGALADAGIAFVPSIERAVNAVAEVVPDPDPAGPAHDEPGADALGLEAVASFLPADFPWSRWEVVADLGSARRAAEAWGYPLVLKAAGRTIVHRADVGAVRIVRSVADLEPTYSAVADACARAGDVVIAQAWATAGFELLLSVLRDPEFGPVAFVRAGGSFAERMSLQTVLWAGWSDERLATVLRRSPLGELLDGYRGGPKYDLPAIVMLVRTALAAVADDLAALELNPAIVHKDGLQVVDALARRQPPHRQPQRKDQHGSA